MDPFQFYFLILPLAILVFILVIVVVYYARKENNYSVKEIQILNELMQSGVVDYRNYPTALQELVNINIIDKNSFDRMGKLLEEYFIKQEKSQSKPPKLSI
jgi:hypothetical protein